MLRRASVLVVTVLAAACSPTFDVTIGWSVDGEDPASACEFLPAGNVVRVTALSRDASDRRDGLPRETVADLPCDTGSGAIQTGSFADLRAEVVAEETVFGTSGLFEVNPGAVGAGYQVEEQAAVADIRLVRGTLTANLTVVGQGCQEAGASTFTLSLFQNTEPRTNVAVVEDVSVPCTGEAVFKHSPVDLDSVYVIEAVTTVGAASFTTSAEGEGVRTAGANTFFTVDLEAAE